MARMIDNLTIKTVATGSEDYRAAVRLRVEVLRRPIGLDADTFDMESERRMTHFAAMLDGEVIGTLCLDPLDREVIKMRQVGVRDDMRFSGIGLALVRHAEAHAQGLGYRMITAHARESALDFYAKLGYTICPGTFLEVNLPHRKISKQLVISQPDA